MEWMSGLSLASVLKAPVMTLNESWGSRGPTEGEAGGVLPKHHPPPPPHPAGPSDAINKQTCCVRIDIRSSHAIHLFIYLFFTCSFGFLAF